MRYPMKTPSRPYNVSEESWVQKDRDSFCKKATDWSNPSFINLLQFTREVREVCSRECLRVVLNNRFKESNNKL